MKKCLVNFIYLFCSISFGQKVETEEFYSKKIENKRNIELIYCSNNKRFSVKLAGKKIEEVEIGDGYNNESNKYFIAVDGTIIQCMIIPIPAHLKKTNYEDTEKILKEYLVYELNHIKNELKVNISDDLMMPGNLASRKYLLWKYKLTDNININDGETVKGQIHLSTICFNQILTLGIPIQDFSLENKYKRKLINIARRITMAEKPCEK